MLTATGFHRLSDSYRKFAFGLPGGDRFIDLLADAIKACGVGDAKLDRLMDRAYSTGNMVDIEKAKEVFHSRLRDFAKSALPDGVCVNSLFDDSLKQEG